MHQFSHRLLFPALDCVTGYARGNGAKMVHGQITDFTFSPIGSGSRDAKVLGERGRAATVDGAIGSEIHWSHINDFELHTRARSAPEFRFFFSARGDRSGMLCCTFGKYN